MAWPAGSATDYGQAGTVPAVVFPLSSTNPFGSSAVRNTPIHHSARASVAFADYIFCARLRPLHHTRQFDVNSRQIARW